MLEDRNKRDMTQLINQICKRVGNSPNFALLIGAGASIASGVKPTSQMIVEWQKQLHLQSKSSESLDAWLKKQDWFEDDEEYSILFEKCYDEPPMRRNYIENCVKDARPSWGYVYLSNIIANNYFNVVFTPNFDDLLNEACFEYAECKPVVCAHDSVVSDIRITSVRPKIIKLHGDFLYDRLKNTIKETSSLEENMRDKFVQFAREYGLVVVGYGGNDKSIMDILEMMLRSEGYLPNGLYWCLRRGGKVSKKLRRLMQQEKAYWTEIDGFDEFMAELHKGLGLTLPNIVRDPYKATTDKLNNSVLIKTEVKHPIIQSDIAELEKQVRNFERIVSIDQPPEEPRLVPYSFLGDREFGRNNYAKALLYYERALDENPNDWGMMNRLFVSYVGTDNMEEALGIAERIIKVAPDDPSGYKNKGFVLAYSDRVKESLRALEEALKRTPKESTEDRASILVSMSGASLRAGLWKDALSLAERALILDPKSVNAIVNKCSALKKMGKEKQAIGILKKALPKAKTKNERAAISALLERKNALNELRKAIEEDSIVRMHAKRSFTWKEYQDNPDFQRLIAGRSSR